MASLICELLAIIILFEVMLSKAKHLLFVFVNYCQLLLLLLSIIIIVFEVIGQCSG